MSHADRLARFPDPRHARAAARMKVLRQRARNGIAVVPVEINLQAVTEFLANAELLRLDQIEDRQAIGVAIRKLIELLMWRDASLTR
jgi:hypothetical protein